MLMQAAIMATVRAAGSVALKCAQAVCLDAHRMKPDISRSAWPVPPSTFQFDFYLEDDLEAVANDHDIDTSDENSEKYHLEGDVGSQQTVQEAEFQAHCGQATERSSDEAGPATTLDARFGAIKASSSAPHTQRG